MGPRALRHLLLAVAVLLPVFAGAREQNIPPALLPLVKSFEAYARDLDRLDGVLKLAPADAQAAQVTPELLQQLRPPAPGALPAQAETVAVAQRLRLDLQQVIAVAVQNDPVLQEQIARVQEQQGWLKSVRGRLYPILGLNLGGGYSQQKLGSLAWQGNESIYGVDSAFYVPTGGWSRTQTNVGDGFALLQLDYELLSFERNAALAEVKAELEASQQRYGNRLRQLQLNVSEAYYQLQLADQLRRIRQVVVDNDTVIYDQVMAMKIAGLVPRVDLLRAEAMLQQSRFRLQQADALRLSQQRRLSNLVNAPFQITLEASEAVRLQPPWPLDLQQTIVRGFQENPQLEALPSARTALLRQADRRAAELLPRIGLFATGGYLAAQSTSPLVDLQGCCKGPAYIPGLNAQSGEWAAGLRLQWRLFDAGITSGAVDATRAAAERTLQAEAAERNGIRQRLETAYYDHRAALSQIIAANASFRAAREAYRDSRARFEFGLADYTDLADTIRSLTTAMEQQAEAMTLANVSYAQLLRELLPVPTTLDAPVRLPITLSAAKD